MPLFVKLTNSDDGNPIFINFDEVRSMCRIVGEDNPHTTLTFDRTNRHDVKETPERIIAKLDNSRRAAISV